MLSEIEAGDLTLIEITDKRSIESRLARDIPYTEVTPAGLVLSVDCIAERNVDYQEPGASSAYASGEFVVDVHRLTYDWVRRIKVRRRKSLASRSQNSVAFAGRCR